MTKPVTLKGEVIAEIVKGNPGQKIKAVEYGQYGEIRRIEWFENEPDDAALDPAKERP